MSNDDRVIINGKPRLIGPSGVYDLYDNEIALLCSMAGVDYYAGYFDNRTLPLYPIDWNSPFCCLLNITPYPTVKDPKTGQIIFDNRPEIKKGTHWVSLYYSPENETIDYMDSYGAPPSEEVLAVMKSSGKKPRFSNSMIQNIFSQACGWFAAAFMICRDQGLSSQEFLDLFDPEPSNENDLIAVELCGKKIS